ncbi:hypothetical protein [Geobacter sp. DSM 9736]|uniref:hypothetical protein n=1 Tax=Geobacter sp. DSM 9736 TaxID=1277350 RepID=UPI000B5112C1|nr:hypothetical protein [Geobacter sp. DSM 9736]SNB47696.1 hypothetical protein SAMN06269301_3188 [Geobacter sp. DSM 9736]
MKRVLIVFAVFMLVSVPTHGVAKSLYLSDTELRTEAQRGFEQILDLWREGKFAELYGRTRGSSQSREAFAARLSVAPVRPACCWEKMQDVSVRLQNDSTAVVKAKLGFEGKEGTSYHTGSFRLVKEEDVWSISRSDIFKLAGEGKKKNARSGSRTR